MHIVCPHCTTSYAIDLATLGAAGRSVRCSRCKEVWLARPEDAIEIAAQVPAMANAENQDAAAEWDALAREDSGQEETPVVDSPSISGDWPDEEDASEAGKGDWASTAQDDEGNEDDEDDGAARPRRLSRLQNLLARLGAPGKSPIGLPTACAAMPTISLIVGNPVGANLTLVSPICAMSHCALTRVSPHSES